MKQLLIIFFVSASITCYSQKKKAEGFAMINAGMFKPGSYKPYVTFSFGPGKNKDGFGVGAGVGYYDMEKAYIPVFATVNLTGPPKKVSPFFNANVGYGVYSLIVAGVKITGGMYLKGNGGVAFPMGNTNSKGFICAGVTVMQFKASSSSGNQNTKASNASGMFNIGLGVRFSS